jgi:hypothetical protein
MPPVPAVASGCGGGQLIWLALTVLVPACAGAADAAVFSPRAARAGGRR